MSNAGFTTRPPWATSQTTELFTATKEAFFENIDVSFEGANVVGLSPLALPPPLQSISTLPTVSNEMLYTVATNQYDLTPITAQSRTLLQQNTASAQRSILGTAIGTDVQQFTNGLQSISNVSSTIPPDRLLYSTAADNWASTPISAFARSVIDDTSATAMRTTIDALQRVVAPIINTIPKWDGASELTTTSVTIDAGNNVGGVQNLSVVGDIDGITSMERAQLANINTSVITSGNWSNLSLLDQSVGTSSTPTFQGLNAGGQVISNVGNPIVANDATNKTYVDTLLMGITPLTAISPVNYATNAIIPNIPIYSSVTSTLTATTFGALSVDGSLPSIGNRILVKDQLDNRENGVYVVTLAGSGITTWLLTRSLDYNQAAMPIRALMYVTSGLVNSDTTWVNQTTVNIINPLTDPVVFVQFSGSGNLTAGNGLTKIGNTLDVNVAPSRTFINGSNQVDIVVPVVVASGGTGNTSLSSNGVLIGQGTAAVNTSKAAPVGDFVGTTDVQSLTNKIITNSTVTATKLATTGGNVGVDTAAPPVTGQVLTATSATSAAWAAPTVNYARLIVVAKTGGHFTTLAAAITAAIALVPSVINWVMIVMYPGVYVEVNPIIVPQFVAISSASGIGNPVTISPVTSTLAILQLSSNVNISGVMISGATGVGGIGINIPALQSRIYIALCNIVNCETGLFITGGAIAGLNACVLGGTMSTGISATVGATVNVNIVGVRGTTLLPIPIGFNCDGVGTTLIGIGIQSQYCGIGMRVDNGGTVRFSSGGIFGSITTGLQVGAASVVEAHGLIVSESGVYDLHLTNSTGTFRGTGNKLRTDLIFNPSMGTVIGEFISLLKADEGVNIRGEFSVGYVNQPSEISMGSGDAYINGMHVMRSTNDIAFTDITALVSIPNDIPTATAFNSLLATEKMYIGSEYASFKGIFMNIANGILPANGTGTIALQYWNGITWVITNIMSTDLLSPFMPHANEVLNFGTYHYRFGDMTGFTQSTINGIFAYWVRFITLAPILQIPLIDQIKLHSNRVRISREGFLEYFGNAQPIVKMPFDYKVLSSTNAPANQDAYIDDTLGVGRELNSFNNTGIDSNTFVFELPDNLNTALPIKFLVRYFVNNNAAGNVEMAVIWGYNVDIQDDPTPVGTTISSTWPSTGTAPTVAPGRLGNTAGLIAIALNRANRMLTHEFSINIPTLRSRRNTGSQSGDVLWVTFSRNGSSVNDTYAGDFIVIQITPKYTKWCEGSYG